MFDLVADLMLTFTTYQTVLFFTLAGSLFAGRRLFFQCACLVAFGIIINVVLKGTFQIPSSVHPSMGSYAFPSGHMQLTTVFYVWWAIYIPFWYYRTLTAAIVLGVGVSLVHFKYHTIYDVTGGLLFGLLIVFCFYYLLTKNIKYFPWALLLAASIFMVCNEHIYDMTPPHAWIAYQGLVALIIGERLFSLNGRYFSLWLYEKK